jgi:diguanylate cyclase (GGDEF)-like protein
MVRESIPDLILLDAEMPGMSGFLVCEALKADRELAHVPVIFITSHREPGFEVSGFDLGAADFIAKPVNASLVLARVKAQLRVKRLADESRRLAMTDGLTGVANRRHFDESLEREWNSARRAGDAMALLMIDVDHFKAFNDACGHQRGDECLQLVARCLSEGIQREEDVLARYGGEEFAAILRTSGPAEAATAAEAFRERVERLRLPHPAAPSGSYVTVSVGVATAIPRPGASPSTLLAAADDALYRSKHMGRNRVTAIDKV